MKTLSKHLLKLLALMLCAVLALDAISCGGDDDDDEDDVQQPKVVSIPDGTYSVGGFIFTISGKTVTESTGRAVCTVDSEGRITVTINSETWVISAYEGGDIVLAKTKDGTTTTYKGTLEGGKLVDESDSSKSVPIAKKDKLKAGAYTISGFTFKTLGKTVKNSSGKSIGSVVDDGTVTIEKSDSETWTISAFANGDIELVSTASDGTKTTYFGNFNDGLKNVADPTDTLEVSKLVLVVKIDDGTYTIDGKDYTIASSVMKDSDGNTIGSVDSDGILTVNYSDSETWTITAYDDGTVELVKSVTTGSDTTETFYTGKFEGSSAKLKKDGTDESDTVTIAKKATSESGATGGAVSGKTYYVYSYYEEGTGVEAGRTWTSTISEGTATYNNSVTGESITYTGVTDNWKYTSATETDDAKAADRFANVQNYLRSALTFYSDGKFEFTKYDMGSNSEFKYSGTYTQSGTSLSLTYTDVSPAGKDYPESATITVSSDGAELTYAYEYGEDSLKFNVTKKFSTTKGTVEGSGTGGTVTESAEIYLADGTIIPGTTASLTDEQKSKVLGIVITHYNNPSFGEFYYLLALNEVQGTYSEVTAATDEYSVSSTDNYSFERAYIPESEDYAYLYANKAKINAAIDKIGTGTKLKDDVYWCKVYDESTGQFSTGAVNLANNTTVSTTESATHYSRIFACIKIAGSGGTGSGAIDIPLETHQPVVSSWYDTYEIYFAYGETWRQAIANHSENSALWSIEAISGVDDVVVKITTELHAGALKAGMFGNYINPDAEIDFSGPEYYIEEIF